MWKMVKAYVWVVPFFIVAAILLGYDTFMYHKSADTAMSRRTFQEQIAQSPSLEIQHETYSEGKPTRLVIPSLSIDLAVRDGVYDDEDKTWTLSNDAAQYALITPLANNEAGNTFIYGHNRKEVFANLSQIVKGSEAELHTDSGYVFRYNFQSSYVTDPYDDSLFSYRGAPILTIQTCTGLWYQDRQLFTFTLKEVTT